MRLRGAIVIGFLSALVLVSCGDDDENRLSEAEFTSRGNAICASHAGAIEEASRARFTASREVPSADQIEAFAEGTVIPEMDRMVDELEDLKPEEDEDDFEAFRKDVRRALDDDVKQDPSSILSEQATSDPFREANEKAEDAGLTECARVSQRIRTAAAARAR